MGGAGKKPVLGAAAGRSVRAIGGIVHLVVPLRDGLAWCAVDYYDVLGIARGASVDEIERAYRAMARKVHPDRNSGDRKAEARMKQLNEIRETLSDPLLRAAYDDQLRREDAPAPPPPRPRERPPAAPRAEDRWRQTAPPRYDPHPHVASFLRTEAERARVSPPRRRESGPVVAIVLLVAAGVAGFAFLWPSSDPTPPRAPLTAPPPPPPPKKPAVVVVRGDTAATRQAIRKTARVVPVGFTLDEVIAKFGPPDRVVSHPTLGDLTLIYGKVKVEMREGKVVGGIP
jgi:hypothetical protein